MNAIAHRPSTSSGTAQQLVTKPKALELMAARVNVDPAKMLATLKATAFKGANDDELLALVVVANEYGLNPFLKEIYAFPAKGGGICPVVGVDGWLKMVNRAENFDGVEFDFADSEDGQPVACTCRLFITGRSRPVAITEYFSECVRNTEPWKNMPRRMLRHKALIQCARVAFGFTGVVDEDEGADIRSTVTVESEKVRGGDRETRAPRAALPPAVVGRDSVEPRASDDGDLGPQTPVDGAPVGRVPSPGARAHAYEEMQVLLDECGVGINALAVWGEQSGNIPNASSYATLDEIPHNIISRLMKARAGLKTGLLAVKEQMAR